MDPLGLVVALLYPGLAARARPRLVEVDPYRPGARPLHVPGALGRPPASDLGPGVAQQPAEHQVAAEKRDLGVDPEYIKVLALDMEFHY